MWGTSYADLAKQAQEYQQQLAEQAALAASNLSVRLTSVV
jgi:hypothetical protein